MNIAKNMEAIFVAAIALASVTSFATAAIPAHHTARVQTVAQANNNTMPVVTIVGKRLSAAEKAALAN